MRLYVVESCYECPCFDSCDADVGEIIPDACHLQSDDEIPQWIVDKVNEMKKWWVNHISYKAPELADEICEGLGAIRALTWVLTIRKD